MSSRSFKLTVKDGDTRSKYNSKTGAYDWEKFDYVSEPLDLGDAMFQFLEYANDEYLDDKVTLTLSPGKRAKKKK